jgi:FkbM family methyltransferase
MPLDFMNIPSFLYRRLAKWVTCELGVGGGNRVCLRSKYDVASFADVFCHPFYWQVYSMLDTTPRSVVDCGGHLGHFSILVEQCVMARFGQSEAHYWLIEPNPVLLSMLTANLANAGIGSRAEIVNCLLDANSEGYGELWTSSKNLLCSSCAREPGRRKHLIPRASLADICPPGPIDILKIDIEGAELLLIPVIRDILQRTRILMVEFHSSNEDILNAAKTTIHEMWAAA